MIYINARRAVCFATLIRFLFLDPIRGSSLLRHEKGTEQTFDHVHPPPTTTPTPSIRKEPFVDLSDPSNDEIIMNEIIQRIKTNNGVADSELPTQDDNTDRILSEFEQYRELDGLLDYDTSPEESSDYTNSGYTTWKKNKKKKKTKPKNNSATPAPTEPFEPVDDLTIPPDLDACLLRALPRRDPALMVRRKKKKKKKHVTTSTQQYTNEIQSEPSFLQQDESGNGFDYMASDEVDSVVTSHNSEIKYASYDDDDLFDNRLDEHDYEEDSDDDGDTHTYDNHVYTFFYDDDDDELSDSRNLQLVADDWDRTAVSRDNDSFQLLDYVGLLQTYSFLCVSFRSMIVSDRIKMMSGLLQSVFPELLYQQKLR